MKPPQQAGDILNITFSSVSSAALGIVERAGGHDNDFVDDGPHRGESA